MTAATIPSLADSLALENGHEPTSPQTLLPLDADYASHYTDQEAQVLARYRETFAKWDQARAEVRRLLDFCSNALEQSIATAADCVTAEFPRLRQAEIQAFLLQLVACRAEADAIAVLCVVYPRVTTRLREQAQTLEAGIMEKVRATGIVPQIWRDIFNGHPARNDLLAKARDAQGRGGLMYEPARTVQQRIAALEGLARSELLKSLQVFEYLNRAVEHIPGE